MLKRILINFALRILKSEVLDKIEYTPAQGLTNIAFENLQSSANIVLDGDPNNKAQFAELWQKNKVQILGGALEATKLIIIEEVKDQRTETLIVGLIDEIKAELQAGNVLKIAA